MKRKIISLLMVAVILTATIPLDFLQFNIDNKAKASGNTVILDDGRVVTLPPEVPTQITVKGNTYPINKELLADSGITSVPNLDSGIAVYGTYNDVKNIYGNDYDSQSGEWRYIGFDINGNKYSNPDFPPDADSGRSPSQKNWQSLDYIYSMGIENESPYNEDSNAGEWLKTMVWVRDIERGGKTPDEYDPIWLAEHFHILSPPTEYTAGLARGWHKTSDGRLWYETFVMPPSEKIEVPENPPSITADFELKNEVYEYQDVGYKDTSYAEYSAIEYRKLTITGDNGYSNVIKNSTSPTIKLKEGSYTFTLEVRNNAGQTDTMTKNITVIKQQEEVPSKAIAIINGPSEVPINNSFTVTGEGSFPSIGAKIVEWKWYIGTDSINLIHNLTYDNQSSINISYSTEGDRYFKLWIKDSAGKEAWSNIHYTKINSGIVASAKAKINVPSYGYEGVPFSISTHGSYVTVEGEKYSLKKAVELEYADFRITGAKAFGGKYTAYGGNGVIYELGDHDVNLKIYPINGDDVKATDYITILPTPKATLRYSGELKENRLIMFDASDSKFNELHPYVPEKTYLVIKNLDTNESVKLYCGQSIQNDYIKSLSFNDLKLKCIFAPGNYEITFYTEDDRGNFDTSEVEFTINEDKPPKPIVYSQPTIFRNPDTKKALIEFESKTKSIDSDYIDYKEYYYKYDDDNDGNFYDESWSFITRTINDKTSFQVDSVGNYLIREFAKEKFGSDTIESFVTEGDRKESIYEFEIEVNNKEPMASTLPIITKNIDVMINYDYKDKDEITNTVSIYEDKIINNKDLLLKPYTYLNDIYTTNENFIVGNQGSIGWDFVYVFDECDKYIIFRTVKIGYQDEYMLVEKDTFNIIDKINSPIEFLGNTNKIITNYGIYDISSKNYYSFSGGFNTDYPYYFNEDNQLLYYTNGINHLKIYNLVNYTIEDTGLLGTEYIVIYADENNIYLLRNDLRTGVDNKANIEIITTDLNFNILNTSSVTTDIPFVSDYSLAPYSCDKYDKGIRRTLYDKDTDSIYLLLDLKNREHLGDYRFNYYIYFRLLKINRNGNIEFIKKVKNDTRYRLIEDVKFTMKNNKFRVFVYDSKIDIMDFIHYDKVLNQLDNIRFNKGFHSNKDNMNDFIIYMEYNGADNIFKLYDIENKQLLIDYGREDYDYYIKDIKYSPYEFFIKDYNDAYIYNTLTNSYTPFPIAPDYEKQPNFIKVNDKIHMIYGNGTSNHSYYLYSYRKINNSYVQDSSIYTGRTRKTISKCGWYILSYSGGSYKYSKVNPTFSHIIDEIDSFDFINDDKYIVIFNDNPVYFTDDNKSNLINTIIDKNAKLIWFGNDNNISLAQEIILQTGGYYRSFSTFSNMMRDLADVLKQDNSDLSDRERTIYIKKGEYIDYERIFADYENDPQHIESGEQWLYIHDPNYFSNNDGLASFHNVWLTEPIIQFDKVGKYTVTLKLRDNPVDSDDRFDNYRKWSSGLNKIDIIVYDDDSVLPPVEPDIPLQLNVDIVGDLRVNHRVDFIINATKGSNDIDWNSLDISFDRAGYLPNLKPNALEFSRVFSQTGEHNITVTLKDVEGNSTTVTVPFTINDDLPPVADFSLVGDGYRNELGIANFEINDSSYSNDDEIGTVEYYLEGTKYIDNGDGTYTPSGTEWYSIEPNEYGEIELDKIGLNKIKQVVTETYVNGIGLNGEDLDQYRVFESSEMIKTVNVINEVIQVEYVVTPNIVKVGDSIEHIINITDDTPSGDYVEYKLIHDDTYFENSQGVHVNNNIVTTEPTKTLDKKGKYDFYVRAYDEDGASTAWVHGGQVIVASEPIADFELVSPGNEVGNDVFKKGSVITIENKAYNEDYGLTVPNHGIEYMKVEYKNIASDSYTTIFESDNMPNYVPTFDIPQINESGIYEVKMTIRSPEGFESTCTKQFTVLDLRLDAELEPSTIYASQSYKVKAKLSIDGLGAVVYIPYSDTWITLDKVNEDSNNKYYEKEITTDVTLVDGTYDIEIYGIYPYNNEIKEVIPLTVETLLEINVSLSPSYPTGIAASESIQIEAITTCPVDVNNVEVWLEGESSINLTKGAKVGNDITWTGTYTISSAKPDKDYYNFYVRGNIPNGNETIVQDKVKVETPINLIGSINGSDSNAVMILDRDNTIRATTSIYVNDVDVNILGTNFDMIEISNDGTTKTWEEIVYIDPAVGEISDIAIFTARTTNNKIGTYNLDFTTKIALAITGQVNPNPALAGERVHFTCDTEGYAEKVIIELWNGEQVELIPDNEPATNDLNTWRGSYIVPLETPDATYEIVATAERAGRIETDNLQLTIKGNMFELVKPRIRNSN